MFAEKILYWFSFPIVRAYTRMILNMDVHKRHLLPSGAKIIAANHPSTTDPFFVASMVGQQSFILISETLFQVPILGRYLSFSGHISVQPGNGPAALESALRHLQAGHTVIIFPEGALSPEEGGVHRSRTGAARLALLSGAPVIPVGIHLQRERVRTIRSTVQGKVEYGRWYLRGPYHITVGHALQYTGDVEDRPHVRAVADHMMLHISELARESENRFKGLPGNLNGALSPL
jgi:1-acyl-sn-glycerol-3-phosphate acyltransferase